MYNDKEIRSTKTHEQTRTIRGVRVGSWIVHAVDTYSTRYYRRLPNSRRKIVMQQQSYFLQF
ncbi:MAG: hypothetical protein ACREBG_28960 [Pyrinomonadaceae bacterium]